MAGRDEGIMQRPARSTGPASCAVWYLSVRSKSTLNRMRDLIPAPIFDSIQAHLRQAASAAPSGWESNSEEEDSLTGDLGHVLCAPRSGPVHVDGEIWHWRITYRKFRGRGKGALEARIGADGIVQIEVSRGDAVYFKGLLFQAKKENNLRRRDLQKQIEAMEGVAPGASAVVVYRPREYTAISGRDYLRVDPGVVGEAKIVQPLGSFLEEFLECEKGMRDMYYEAVRKRLIVPVVTGGIRAVPLEIRHRIEIEIGRS